jgi:PqqD family protein of HPr-rel-A system
VSEAPERWWVGAGAQFDFRHFGDESALFDRRSGLTHFLSAAAVEALEFLSERALSVTELTDRLAALCEPPVPENFDLQVERMLRQLANLDLIEPAPGDVR